MKNRTVLLYMTFVFLSNFSTILYFLTVYLEFVGFSMVAISSMMIAYQVSKFILEVPTGYIADRFGRKTSGLVGVVGMLGYYAALLFARSPLLLIGAFALKGFAVACVSGSIEAIYIDSVSQDQLVRLNVVERFVFYASYAISACVGGFISSVGAYLIGLSADIIAMVLTLVVVACIPEMRRGDTAATPKRGISPKMIGAAIARNGILRSAFIMDCSQAFAFVALEDFFSLLLAGRGMNAVASGVTIAVQLLASASMGLIVPSVIAHVDKGRFARICGIVRLFLTALFLIPFTPVYLLPVFYVLQTVAYSLFGGADRKLDREAVRTGGSHVQQGEGRALPPGDGGRHGADRRRGVRGGHTVGAAKKWATGHLPHSYTGARCRIGARKPRRKEASLGPDKSIYAPPATGPLAGLNEDQIENLLLRAVLADLKAEGWDPASISNRSKCELGERLRRATALPLRSITGFLRISKSSYEYWRPRVAAPRDRDADIRDRVVRIFREGSGCWGYRTVWARLRREGVRASEKRVARVMREEGLEVVYNRRRARGYSSYAGEVSKAPENLVNRNFHADEPNRLWLTDITEFRLPGGEKVYLSPVIDCFDGMPVAWSIGLHPDKRLANSSLLKACAARPAGARTTIHSDRGGHYRWPEWIGICEENGLVRSMSAKGCSPDNSACEGFFGRLKNEFFRYRDWEGVTAGEFMGRLEAYLVYYREGRIKKSLGWLSPMEYRRKLGYA